MDRRIEAALRMMHRDPRNLRTADVACSVNLSMWHFAHLFKTETSVSPKRYMRNLKMKEAERLLDESFLSVKEIAAKVAIGDRSHFSRDFKRISGHSPSNFRVRNHEKRTAR
jgi:transcriptional regulator GlxA family with amidase domain